MYFFVISAALSVKNLLVVDLMPGHAAMWYSGAAVGVSIIAEVNLSYRLTHRSWWRVLTVLRLAALQRLRLII